MPEAILVAGGAGYIGAHVCKALHHAGYAPIVLDDLSAGRRDFVRWGPLVHAAVTDEAAVARAITDHSIKAAIDLAGSIEVAESMRDPLKYYDNNVSAKISFLRTLVACGVTGFVLSSTAAVYGEAGTVPIPETHPARPKNPYGRTKLVFEEMLRDVRGAGGPAWMALRYFNAAGASPDGEIGEAHDPETHLIPRACLAALGRIPALEIFGNDYPTPDGTAIRDYVHVCDLATAHVAAVEALLAGQDSAVYNLGTGHGISIGEILRCFERLGHTVPHSFAPRRPGDPARLVADPGGARRELGWIPASSAIETIVSSALAWHAAFHVADGI